jgi:hypothetical protein
VPAARRRKHFPAARRPAEMQFFGNGDEAAQLAKFHDGKVLALQDNCIRILYNPLAIAAAHPPP